MSPGAKNLHQDLNESGEYRKNAPERRIREEGIGEMTIVRPDQTESAKEMSWV